MQWQDILVYLATTGLCVLSFFIMKYVMENSETDKENGLQELKVTRNVYIYGVIFTVVTVAICVMLRKFYTETGIIFDVKRAFLLSVLWPVAYIDLKSYRIPNVFIIYGVDGSKAMETAYESIAMDERGIICRNNRM